MRTLKSTRLPPAAALIALLAFAVSAWLPSPTGASEGERGSEVADVAPLSPMAQNPILAMIHDPRTGEIHKFRRTDIQACRAFHRLAAQFALPPDAETDTIVCDLIHLKQCSCEGLQSCDWLADSGLCKEGSQGVVCNDVWPPDCGCDTH